MIRFSAAALAVFFMVAEARAEFILSMPTICFDGIEARGFLKKLGEPESQGLMTDQLLVELRVRPDGQYAVTVMNKAGRVCVIAVGTDWTGVKKITKGEKS